MQGVFFILGTDTGVGKTVFSLLCMQSLVHRGFAPAYVKPFQTGCVDVEDEGSDARFVRTHLPAGHTRRVECSTLLCFRAPKAPYFAARTEKKPIDPGEIHRGVKRLSKGPWTHLIIEGAGGILVPVTADRLLIDVVQSLEMKSDIILVARAGLGTINHTLLSIEALAYRMLHPKAIVLIDNKEPGTPRDMVEENMEAIETFSGIRPAGVIAKIDDFTAPGDAAYNVTESVLISSADWRETAARFTGPKERP